jgi:hypothetical protein
MGDVPTWACRYGALFVAREVATAARLSVTHVAPISERQGDFGIQSVALYIRLIGNSLRFKITPSAANWIIKKMKNVCRADR